MSEEIKPVLDSKPFWLSKTVWFNFAVFVASFFPQVQVIVQAHPELVIGAIALINKGLRFVSKDKVTLG